jgi:protoporphyrinogen oxidase
MSGREVVVIGAGCAGLAAAYMLKGRGRKVVVFEAQAEAGGRLATGQSAAEAVTAELGRA